MKRREFDQSKEIYLKAGAEMRLFKALASRMRKDVGAVLTDAERHRLVRALNMIEELCPAAEDSMLRSHAVGSFGWSEVFYGAIDEKPRNKVDEKVIGIAREVAHELFKGKGD